MINDEIMIKSINDLLSMEKLNIPIYQRPYDWSKKNILELLSDINDAIEKQKQYGSNFRYRIGTIILHENYENKEYKLDIVDGQQRIISLLLLNKYLDKNFESDLLKTEFNNKITIYNISENYKYIEEYFIFRENLKQNFIKAFTNLLEVVVIKVEDISEAFQLFDSQNSKGKSLEPLDLLKAYHLREMKDETEITKKVIINKWESKAQAIKDLFNIYLFPIYNWSRGKKSKKFTKDDIFVYKGINKDSNYSYAKRAKKAGECFQITESFTSGKSFFEMIYYYIYLIDEIKVKLNENYSYITNILNEYKNIYAIKYVKDLFLCAILFYYDRFNNLNEDVVRKLFVWSLMLRIDLEVVQYDSINKYAIGEYSWKYSNQIPIFEKIKYARTDDEIANIEVKVFHKNNQKLGIWQKLYDDLKKIIR